MRSDIYDFFQMCQNIKNLRKVYGKDYANDDYEDFHTVCVEFVNSYRKFNGAFR